MGKGCLQFGLFFPNHPLYNTSDEFVQSRPENCLHIGQTHQDTACHPLDIHRDQDLKTPKPPPGWFHDFKSEMVLMFCYYSNRSKVLLEISGI